jgi:hypothetical protein
LELQPQLGFSRHETAFKLMHKIRLLMGRRYSLYLLKYMTENDGDFVDVSTKKLIICQVKLGKGSQLQPLAGIKYPFYSNFRDRGD